MKLEQISTIEREPKIREKHKGHVTVSKMKKIIIIILKSVGIT